MGALLVIGAANAASAAGSLHLESWENNDCNEEVFQSALNEIRHKNYEQGRLLLKKLVNRKCSLMPVAMLLIADSSYREGGSRCLGEAHGEYTRWLGLFPERELAPLVMKKLAEVHLRQLNRRDDVHSSLANKTLLRLQDLCPQFSVDPGVQEYIMVTQELHAEHQLKVARFYLDVRESAQVAKMRCLEILEKSPRFTKMDIALWYLAQADEGLAQTEEWEDNINEAIASYQRLAREHADSEYRERAIERLKYFGRDVPEPDPEVNATRRERASKVRSILADIDAYVLGISRRGVLLNEEDDVESDELSRMLKETSAASSSAKSN